MTDAIGCGVGRLFLWQDDLPRNMATYITQAKLYIFLMLTLAFTLSYGVYKLSKPEMKEKYGNFY